MTPMPRAAQSDDPNLTDNLTAMFEIPSVPRMAVDPPPIDCGASDAPLDDPSLAEPMPARVKGNVLDALSAIAVSRGGGTPSSEHISAVQSDENGFYHFFRSDPS